MRLYGRIAWDPKKAEINLRKHGVSFVEAADTLSNPLTREDLDPYHQEREDRFIAIGESRRGKYLFIAYTIRGDDAWIISARLAAPSEKRSYMSGRDIIRETPIYDDEDPADREYDFSNAKPIGLKFAKLQMAVALDPDVCDVFRTEEEVNDALRMLIREGRVPHITYPTR